MATKEKKEEVVIEATQVEKEYRFAIYDDKTETTEEMVLKESELTDEHHKAMFYDMWEYFENASRNAQQLFLLKLQMSQHKPTEGQVESTKKAYKDEIEGVK
tara:strand:+ start:328 stop:633 length:306 start_codon:yes stop_codon:yes gene_type:complete